MNDELATGSGDRGDAPRHMSRYLSNKVAGMDIRKHLKGEINYDCEREGSLLRASGGSLYIGKGLESPEY
jgi:hypothetical protein